MVVPAGKFAGYRIAKGKLNLTLAYHIHGRSLKSENLIVLDQFTFGEKVDSPDATHLPVRLAIAVLKDRDGRIVLDIEPVAGKCRAFGWDTAEIDGNAMADIVAALHDARRHNGRPKAIVLRTLPGRGIATLERREKSHFVRVEPHEWASFENELETGDV